MADDDYEYKNERSIDSSLICSICRGPFNDPYSTQCKHIYCRECINHCLQNDNRCSICRRPIKRTDLTKAEAICNAVNQLLVICKRCNQDVRRGQFNEHIRNNCDRIRSDLRPIINPERIELLVNLPLKQCQQLREELQRQRIEINKNHDHANNNMNAINGKLKEQQDEIEILKKSNAIQRRKIEELEHDIQMREEKTEKQEKFIDELENDNRRLRNYIKRFNDESNQSKLRFRNLEEKIIQLLPYSNDELEDYITTKCEFGSQFALRAADLTDRDVEIIVKRVIINRQCSGLNLRKNQITSQGALLIADVFHRNIRLRILDLSYNDISDRGTQYLAEALLENQTLKELSLGSNEITNRGIKYLTEMLRLNETLKKLDLFENEFDDDGLKLLTNVLLKDNRTLVELSIRGNKLITDKSVYTIIDMFKENRTLNRVEIDQCEFSNGTKTRLRDAADNASITIDI